MTETEIDISNRVKQLRKGLVEYLLLLVLDKKPQYTGEILKKLDKAGISVVEGTLYPLLSRLSKQGMVSYTWEEAKTGHPRKYYELAPKGTETLKHLKIAWSDIEATVSKLQK